MYPNGLAIRVVQKTHKNEKEKNLSSWKGLVVAADFGGEKEE